MAISQIGGSTSSASAAAPTAPAGYAVFDGGTISTGRYTLPGLSRAGYVFGTGQPNGTVWLRDKTNGRYYTAAGYGTGTYTAFTLSGSATCDVVTNINNTLMPAASVSAKNFIYRAGSAYFTTGSNNSLYRSTDGATWSVVSGPTSVVSMAYNGSNLYIAISATAIWTSADGISWTSRSVPGSPGTMVKAYQVAYGNGVFVLTGMYSTSTQEIWSSTDGITWTGRLGYNWSYQWDTLTHNGLTGANSLFIVSYYTGYFYSTDGATWTSGSMPANAYASISYANGVWVMTAGGNFGSTHYYYSTNGTTWTAATLSVGAPIVPTGNASAGTIQSYGHFYSNGTWWFALYASSWSQSYPILFPITDPTYPGTVRVNAGVPGNISGGNSGISNNQYMTDESGNIYWMDVNGGIQKSNSTLTSGNIFGRFQLYSDFYRTLN
jgi:hypothetical protein